MMEITVLNTVVMMNFLLCRIVTVTMILMRGTLLRVRDVTWWARVITRIPVVRRLAW